jgi:hypothetical protein
MLLDKWTHHAIRFIFIPFISSFLLLINLTYAQALPPSKKGTSKLKVATQVAIVQDGGATVFPSISFDSDPIAYLNPGQKVKASRKKYPGKEGFGLFYKVYISKSKSGYVSDVELIPQFTETKFTKREKENPEFDEVTKETEPQQEPLLFTRFMGLSLNSIQYKEAFAGGDLQSSTPFYGLKLTGPGYLFEEVPLDIDILLAPAPPDYYDRVLSTAPSSGLAIFSTLALKFPFIDLDNFHVYYSLGLLANYSRFKIQIGSNSFDSQEFKVGLLGGLGAALRFRGRFFLQGDARYYYEKTEYWGYGISFGRQY